MRRPRRLAGLSGAGEGSGAAGKLKEPRCVGCALRRIGCGCAGARAGLAATKASAPLSTLAGQDKPPLRRLDSPGSAVAPQAGSLARADSRPFRRGQLCAPVNGKSFPSHNPPRARPIRRPSRRKRRSRRWSLTNPPMSPSSGLCGLRSTYAPPGQHLLAPAPPPVDGRAEPTIKAKGKPKSR